VLPLLILADERLENFRFYWWRFEMTKTGWLIAGLFFLLLGTNVWWIYATVNQAVSLTYSRDSLQMNKTAVAQLLAVVEESREADASRQSIVEAALSPFADHDHRP